MAVILRGPRPVRINYTLLPIYAKAGRVVHTFLNGHPETLVTDDFGNSVKADLATILWYLRGPVAAYQPVH